MEQIENIFLCLRHGGCAIRRDPNEGITMTVETMWLARMGLSGARDAQRDCGQCEYSLY